MHTGCLAQRVISNLAQFDFARHLVRLNVRVFFVELSFWVQSPILIQMIFFSYFAFGGWLIYRYNFYSFMAYTRRLYPSDFALLDKYNLFHYFF